MQDNPICLTSFVGKIKAANNGIGPNTKKIWDILVEKGFMYEGLNLNGNKTKLPTELGKQSGLSCVERHSSTEKNYYVVVYDRKGQERLLDCIREIYS